MNLIKNWRPIIDKFSAKLSYWKSKTFSCSGRLTIITSVLGSLRTYFFSLFKATHVSHIDTIQIRRKCIWVGTDGKKKIHLVSWDKVITSKLDGGLGVGSIRALNIGLIVK